MFFIRKAGMHRPLNQTELNHDIGGGTNTVPPIKILRNRRNQGDVQSWGRWQREQLLGLGAIFCLATATDTR